MPPFNHSSTARAWRVVTPNTPVPSSEGAAASVPLHFLSLPGHPRNQSSLDEEPEAALLQAAGPIFVEIPCPQDLKNQPRLLSFTALRHA